MIRRLLAPLLLLLAAAPAAAQADSAVIALGRRYTRYLYEQRTDSLWAVFTPRMRSAMGDRRLFEDVPPGIAAQVGRETAVLSESVTHPPLLPGQARYTRIARFTRVEVPVAVQVFIDSAGMVEGMLVQPQALPAPTRYEGYQTRAALRLPFDGAWTVVWGGRTPQQNYHTTTRDQRFAYDFVVARDGRTHDGDGTAAEQYHCWGRRILAPAEGKVVAAVDGLPDQRPGEMDPGNAAGNHVIVEVAFEEYAVLAHLRRGSVAVRPGDTVRAGQKVGECGNSGNSSEPHLHFHLQNGPTLFRAEGKPAQFNHYLANGERVQRGEPVQGEVVEP